MLPFSKMIEFHVQRKLISWTFRAKNSIFNALYFFSLTKPKTLSNFWFLREVSKNIKNSWVPETPGISFAAQCKPDIFIVSLNVM